jgi:hypothetical protein
VRPAGTDATSDAGVSAGGTVVPTADDPQCAQILSIAELSKASGRDDWTLTADDDEMPDTDMSCAFDRGELYTTDWQHLDVILFSGQTAAGFLTGLVGDPVAVGEEGAWDDVGGRLLVKVGTRVLGIEPGAYLGDTPGREGAIQLAGVILPRL